MSTENALAMLHTMAQMQDEHNALVHPQWRDQGHQYYRAVWVECAEMLDHFGWKWWSGYIDLQYVGLHARREKGMRERGSEGVGHARQTSSVWRLP